MRFTLDISSLDICKERAAYQKSEIEWERGGGERNGEEKRNMVV